MTITRLWQAGAELNDWSHEFDSRDSTLLGTGSTRAKTGMYAFHAIGSSAFTKIFGSTYNQGRAGMWVNHSSSDSGNPDLFTFFNGSTFVLSLNWVVGTTIFDLYFNNGSVIKVGTVTYSAFASTNTWFHFGIDFKLATSGWIYIYINGVQQIAYTGNTSFPVNFDRINVGNKYFGGFWGSDIWFDDIFVDATVGESAAAQVPDLRFDFIQPNADASPNAWTPNSGSTHYNRVNEVAPDGDTTYLEVNTASQEEKFGMANIASLPSGWSIPAVIPVRVGKKQDAGSGLGTQFKLTESSSTANGSTLALTSSYAAASERFTAKPSGGAWTEAAVNGLELSVLSA